MFSLFQTQHCIYSVKDSVRFFSCSNCSSSSEALSESIQTILSSIRKQENQSKYCYFKHVDLGVCFFIVLKFSRFGGNFCQYLSCVICLCPKAGVFNMVYYRHRSKRFVTSGIYVSFADTPPHRSPDFGWWRWIKNAGHYHKKTKMVVIPFQQGPATSTLSQQWWPPCSVVCFKHRNVLRSKTQLEARVFKLAYNTFLLRIFIFWLYEDMDHNLGKIVKMRRTLFPLFLRSWP